METACKANIEKSAVIDNRIDKSVDYFVVSTGIIASNGHT